MKKRKKRFYIILILCVFIVLIGAWEIQSRFSYNTPSGNDDIGQMCDGVYYYEVPHDGIWAYTPEGETMRVLHTFWYEHWQVNDSGIYYIQDKTLGVALHEGGTRTALYRAKGPFAKFGYILQPDGTVLVTERKKAGTYFTEKELFIDGKNGDIIRDNLQPEVYENITLDYSNSHFKVGERELVLVPTDRANMYDVTENGLSIMPEGAAVCSTHPEFYGKSLIFWLDPAKSQIFIVRPDGDDTLIDDVSAYYISAYTEDYLFCANNTYNKVVCQDLRTGEFWTLETEETFMVGGVTSDGDWLVTEGDEIILWKITKDKTGRPEGLKMVEIITKKS